MRSWWKLIPLLILFNLLFPIGIVLLGCFAILILPIAGSAELNRRNIRSFKERLASKNIVYRFFGKLALVLYYLVIYLILLAFTALSVSCLVTIFIIPGWAICMI
jgi:hypothetical protein